MKRPVQAHMCSIFLAECLSQVSDTPSSAPLVPAVSASQTLSAYTVDSFTKDVQQQVKHASCMSYLMHTDVLMSSFQTLCC